MGDNLKIISNKIIRFIANENGSENENLINKTDLILESGYVDSVTLVSLFVFCEEEFNCVIDFESLEQEDFDTVENLSKYILRNKQENG